MGGFIGHVVFATSTLLMLTTLVAIYQRRELLRDLGVHHPGWSAFSFPFANTSIAASLYLRTREPLKEQEAVYHLVLKCWLLVLASIALSIICAVNLIYLVNRLFSGKMSALEPSPPIELLSCVKEDDDGSPISDEPSNAANGRLPYQDADIHIAYNALPSTV
jgi:hypothetical protein